MDIEILFPVDRTTDVPPGFTFKSEFKLTTALKVRHTGSPAGMQDTVNGLLDYMKESKLTPITAAYNVTVQEARTPQNIDSMAVDIYISVTENIL